VKPGSGGQGTAAPTRILVVFGERKTGPGDGKQDSQDSLNSFTLSNAMGPMRLPDDPGFERPGSPLSAATPPLFSSRIDD